jgi:molybdenum cofactor biosynthesis enzyme
MYYIAKITADPVITIQDKTGYDWEALECEIEANTYYSLVKKINAWLDENLVDGYEINSLHTEHNKANKSAIKLLYKDISDWRK